MQIAVIGSGISGLLAARLLATKHHVTLFEASNTLGGHTCTIDVDVRGQRYAVDTGFMVFNERTYPNFSRMLELLEVDSQSSDMSFSVRCDRSGLEYEGSSLNGLFAQRKNLLKPSFYRLLGDIVRFNRAAISKLDSLSDKITLDEFVSSCGLGRAFCEQYLIPMGAAIWSTEPRRMLDFPARFTLAFFHNHGLLQLAGRPIWRTIPGGARRYVERLSRGIHEIELSSPVARVERSEDGVIITARGGLPHSFDQVVFACHSDQALRMLADATVLERAILGAFPYQRNEVIVHTDTSLLPRSRRAWASWNYLTPSMDCERHERVAVTYDLTRLQRVLAPTPILATLNSPLPIDERQVLHRLEFHHPLFTRESAAAQKRWREVNGVRRTWFCGAYWGHGFHEDGVRSALAVTAQFGVQLEACIAACIKEPSGTAAIGR